MGSEAEPSAARKRNGGRSRGAVPVAANPAPTPAATPVAAAAPPTPKRYRASLQGAGELPTDFAEAVLELEKLIGMPIWLLVQDGTSGNVLHDGIEELFFHARHDLPQGGPVAVLVESPGGQADCAYRIARLMQRRCGSFTVIVANWAKSAATLLSLGASEIILGEHAQLGPLDVQVYDHDREGINSALNETQAFERLHAAALEAMDQAMALLKVRTKKRTDVLLPHTLKFISDTMRPLLEKVDVVQYTDRLRTLKVGEEYAIRLLRPRYPALEAGRIARRLVEKYPEHGFVIDYQEAMEIGLRVKTATPDQAVHLDKILHHITSMNALGRVVPV